MEDYQWRMKARTVAFVNVGLLLLVLFMSVVIKDPTVDPESFNSQVFNNKNLEGKSENVLMMVSLFVFAVAIMLLVLGFWAAVKLVRSTEKGRDPQHALQQAQIWQIVNLIYVLLGCLELVMFRSFFSVMVLLALLITVFVFWRIVSKFMDELKQAVVDMKAQQHQAEEKVVGEDSMI